MSRQHKYPLVLTLVWLAAFVANLVILEMYVQKVWPGPMGPQMAIEHAEQWQCLIAYVLPFYGGYLGSILVFWYVKPFRAPRTDKLEAIRFVLALICATLFNTVFLYYVSKLMLYGPDPDHSVVEYVAVAAHICGGMSFIVAPANWYYFGMKRRQ